MYVSNLFEILYQTCIQSRYVKNQRNGKFNDAFPLCIEKFSITIIKLIQSRDLTSIIKWTTRFISLSQSNRQNNIVLDKKILSINNEWLSERFTDIIYVRHYDGKYGKPSKLHLVVSTLPESKTTDITIKEK